VFSYTSCYTKALELPLIFYHVQKGHAPFDSNGCTVPGSLHGLLC